MKFCKDCAWIRYSQIGDDPRCASTDIQRDLPRDPVTGMYLYQYCKDLRAAQGVCSPSAWLFSPKESD
jgi:hypothetical protein